MAAVPSKRIPAPDLVAVRRALISVSDKSGLVDFAASLCHAGIELLSTGDPRKRWPKPGFRSPTSPP